MLSESMRSEITPDAPVQEAALWAARLIDTQSVGFEAEVSASEATTKAIAAGIGIVTEEVVHTRTGDRTVSFRIPSLQETLPLPAREDGMFVAAEGTEMPLEEADRRYAAHCLAANGERLTRGRLIGELFTSVQTAAANGELNVQEVARSFVKKDVYGRDIPDGTVGNDKGAASLVRQVARLSGFNVGLYARTERGDLVAPVLASGNTIASTTDNDEANPKGWRDVVEGVIDQALELHPTVASADGRETDRYSSAEACRQAYEQAYTGEMLTNERAWGAAVNLLARFGGAIIGQAGDASGGDVERANIVVATPLLTVGDVSHVGDALLVPVLQISASSGNGRTVDGTLLEASPVIAAMAREDIFPILKKIQSKPSARDIAKAEERIGSWMQSVNIKVFMASTDGRYLQDATNWREIDLDRNNSANAQRPMTTSPDFSCYVSNLPGLYAPILSKPADTPPTSPNFAGMVGFNTMQEHLTIALEALHRTNAPVEAVADMLSSTGRPLRDTYGFRTEGK